MQLSEFALSHGERTEGQVEAASVEQGPDIGGLLLPCIAAGATEAPPGIRFLGHRGSARAGTAAHEYPRPEDSPALLAALPLGIVAQPAHIARHPAEIAHGSGLGLQSIVGDLEVLPLGPIEAGSRRHRQHVRPASRRSTTGTGHMIWLPAIFAQCTSTVAGSASRILASVRGDRVVSRSISCSIPSTLKISVSAIAGSPPRAALKNISQGGKRRRTC